MPRFAPGTKGNAHACRGRGGRLGLGRQPDRDAYFGETHIHTSWSLDAWLLGNQLTGPADSYKYFKGQTIKHPAGYDIKIVTPLDWAGVTDHSEYVGVTLHANDPNSPLSKLAAAQPLKIDPNKPFAEEGSGSSTCSQRCCSAVRR